MTPTELVPTAPPQAVTIVIPGSRQRIRLQIRDEILIGRADANAGVTPALDLTDFDGAAKGVSRLHAAIRAYREGLALVDLDSTNGTLLNTHRLAPERPYPIKSGDEIRFGDLLIHLFIE